MSAKVPAFSDIGKPVKELLSGGKEGVFQYGQTVNLTTRTADGVEFSLAGSKKDQTVANTLKANYKFGRYALEGTVNSGGQVLASVQASSIAPGLDVTLSGVVPDAASGKAKIKYTLPHLTINALTELTSSPKVELALASGYQNIVAGIETSYDTNKSDVTKWTAAAGLLMDDYQITAILADKGETVKLSYAQNVDPETTIGAEVAHKLQGDSATSVVLGYQRRLRGGGLSKVKLDNSGELAVHYESDINLNPKTRFALSAGFDATNMEKAPKFGLAFNIKP
ncbi:hypothetical protein WJX84_012276 [Apatococcus fuscideae]|uniref:Uncharacterized protein n=1 Tax=Apatococcus fuscideae TaxID=2026836 RepID=A0AAW1T0F8_9CHLO